MSSSVLPGRSAFWDFTRASYFISTLFQSPEFVPTCSVVPPDGQLCASDVKQMLLTNSRGHLSLHRIRVNKGADFLLTIRRVFVSYFLYSQSVLWKIPVTFFCSHAMKRAKALTQPKCNAQCKVNSNRVHFTLVEYLLPSRTHIRAVRVE